MSVAVRAVEAVALDELAELDALGERDAGVLGAPLALRLGGGGIRFVDGHDGSPRGVGRLGRAGLDVLYVHCTRFGRQGRAFLSSSCAGHSPGRLGGRLGRMGVADCNDRGGPPGILQPPDVRAGPIGRGSGRPRRSGRERPGTCGRTGPGSGRIVFGSRGMQSMIVRPHRHVSPSTVDALVRWNSGIEPGLRREKYRRMREDLFAFFRGANHLFADDWATPPAGGPRPVGLDLRRPPPEEPGVLPLRRRVDGLRHQ